MRPRLLLTIKCKFAVDFFARCLHTRTAVARLPLRQLGFFVLPICPALKLKTERRMKFTSGKKAVNITYTTSTDSRWKLKASYEHTAKIRGWRKSRLTIFELMEILADKMFSSLRQTARRLQDTVIFFIYNSASKSHVIQAYLGIGNLYYYYTHWYQIFVWMYYLALCDLEQTL